MKNKIFIYVLFILPLFFASCSLSSEDDDPISDTPTTPPISSDIALDFEKATVIFNPKEYDYPIIEIDKELFSLIRINKDLTTVTLKNEIDCSKFTKYYFSLCNFEDNTNYSTVIPLKNEENYMEDLIHMRVWGLTKNVSYISGDISPISYDNKIATYFQPMILDHTEWSTDNIKYIALGKIYLFEE